MPLIKKSLGRVNLQVSGGQYLNAQEKQVINCFTGNVRPSMMCLDRNTPSTGAPTNKLQVYTPNNATHTHTHTYF